VPGGGTNLDLIGVAEALGIQFVLVHGETAGAIMAGVMGELTGAPGLCLATRGPGAASAMNGVAQALLDRQPMLLVTDSVSAADRRRISRQRLDQQAMLGSVSKASIIIDGHDAETPARCVDLARAGRPGPVHIEIDTTSSARAPMPRPESPGRATADVEAVRATLDAARRTVIVVGVGAVAQTAVLRQRVVEAVNEIGARLNVPVLCTYKARGIVADSSSWSAGVVAGSTIESPLLEGADLIIGIGFDPVELIPGQWPYRAPLVLLGSWEIDDSDYFGERLVAQLVGDIASLVQAVGSLVGSEWSEGTGQRYRQQAVREIDAAVPSAPNGLTPQQIVRHARAAAPSGAIATVDAGAHMLVAMHLWEVDKPGELLISSGLATMGFALPAAIAAALARPDHAVVCFTGDGGLGMVLAELETVARLNLPIVVIVFNDSTLSLIAVKQQPEGHGGLNAVSYHTTDFAAVARGCGMRADRVESVPAYEAALQLALTERRPVLLDVAVDASAYGQVLDAVRGPRS
jgi:acetolactate synthase-1/2/3 large subunit